MTKSTREQVEPLITKIKYYKEMLMVTDSGMPSYKTMYNEYIELTKELYNITMSLPAKETGILRGICKQNLLFQHRYKPKVKE